LVKALRHSTYSPLQNVPNDVFFENIQYNIYIREKTEHALKNVEEGRVLTQKEVKRRMLKWFGNKGSNLYS